LNVGRQPVPNGVWVMHGGNVGFGCGATGCLVALAEPGRMVARGVAFGLVRAAPAAGSILTLLLVAGGGLTAAELGCGTTMRPGFPPFDNSATVMPIPSVSTAATMTTVQFTGQ
jgi:hypothetical protein